MEKNLILIVCLLFTLGSRAQVGEKLLESGMENIKVVKAGDRTIASFENNSYRGTYRGIGEAIIAAMEGLSGGDLELIALDNGIPRLSIILPGALIQGWKDKRITLAEVYEQMSISYNTDEAMRQLKKEHTVLNNASWKPDLVVFPRLKLENSSFDVLYTYAVDLSPAVEMALWKGAELTAQVIFPIATNLKGEYRKVRPGILTLAQEVRFPKNFTGRLVVGNFTNHRLGAQAEITYRLPRGWLEVGALAGTTVQSIITSKEGWYVSTEQRLNAALRASLYERHLNVQLDVQGIRYVYGDYGLRGDCTRHFGEYAIGLYAVYTEGEMNGGFHFTIPLPGRRWKRNHAVRVRPAEYFTGEYSMVSWGEYIDRQMGQSYTTRPDADRSSHFYQPEYIRYFLIKEAIKEDQQ